MVSLNLTIKTVGKNRFVMDSISEISVQKSSLRITLNDTYIFKYQKLRQEIRPAIQNVWKSKTKRTLLICYVLFAVLIYPKSTIIVIENYRQFESWLFPPDRIDWHDWSLIDRDELRDSIGDQGSAVYLSEYPESSKHMNETYGYNGFLSEKIALDRALPDLRPEQ